jgi:tetratricopeptide (TPR) repeat protein
MASLRLAQTWFWLGRARESDESLNSALAYARRAGDRRLENIATMSMFGPVNWGPFTVEESLRRCDEAAARSGGNRAIQATSIGIRGYLLALVGRFDEAIELANRSIEMVEELGLGHFGASLRGQVGVELLDLAGDREGAISMGRQGIEQLQAMGETGFLSTSAGFLARLLAKGGADDEEAERMAELCERSAASDDFSSQALWREARARVLARRGEHESAEVLAREAVLLTDPTDYTIARADARMSLAVVLAAAERPTQAADEVRRALALYEDKGATVPVQRARAVLDRLEPHTAGAPD